MRRDDRDDPFDEFFEEIERMMNDMMGEAGEFHIEGSGSFGEERADGGSEVHWNVHETDEDLRVVADLPGVEKEAIDLRCDGETLTIDAPGSGREYHDRIAFPSPVDEHSADASYNNGVLEVAFERSDDDSTSIDV
ncbi:MAG: Hsp20/alpha crystallin family protein [Haloarculaceae archaeon]